MLLLLDKIEIPGFTDFRNQDLCWKEHYFHSYLPLYSFTTSTMVWGKMIEELLQEILLKLCNSVMGIPHFFKVEDHSSVFKIILLFKHWYLPPSPFICPWSFNFFFFFESLFIDYGKNPQAFAKCAKNLLKLLFVPMKDWTVLLSSVLPVS